MALWILFFFVSLNYYLKSDTKLIQISFLGLFFIFLCILYRWLNISSATLAHCMVRPFVFFSPILALIVIDKCENKSQIKFLLHFIALVIALNIADSIWITLSSGIEDTVYQNLREQEDLENSNLGGNMFVIMAVFYANIIFIAFMNTTDRLEKLFFLLYFGLSAYFIIFCSLKASAILLFIISILLQYMAKMGEKNFRIIMFMSLIFIGILWLYRDQIIYFLIDMIGSDRIASRLEVMLSGASLTDNTSFAGREHLWQTSLQSWVNSPTSFTFGIGDHNWEDFSSTSASGIGDHSDLLDVLARYGIIGGSILYSALIIYYRYLQKKYSTFKFEIIAFFILLILMGLTKKFISGEPSIAIFILFPLCLKHISKNQ